jgi:hypothetical protein
MLNTYVASNILKPYIKNLSKARIYKFILAVQPNKLIERNRIHLCSHPYAELEDYPPQNSNAYL